MPITLFTARDAAILEALNRTPLTAVQLLTLSETFALPFQDERVLRKRMYRLVESGLVRQAFYTALAGRSGMPAYYLLSPAGYRMLHGPDQEPPKRLGKPRSPLRHQHTHLLADLLVHLHRSAHAARTLVTGFCRENSVRLTDGTDSVFPDASFQLVTERGHPFSYFLELDNSTERLTTAKDTDSWERKLRVYDGVRSHTDVRFRVLIVCGKSPERLDHILALARTVTRDARRTVFLGATAASFLAEPALLHAPIFHNHRGERVPLLPPLRAAQPALAPQPQMPAIVNQA